MNTFLPSHKNNPLSDAKSYTHHYHSHSSSEDGAAGPIRLFTPNRGADASYLFSHHNSTQPTYDQPVGFSHSRKSTTQSTQATQREPEGAAAQSSLFSSVMVNGEAEGPFSPVIASSRLNSCADSPANAFVPHIIRSSVYAAESADRPALKDRHRCSPRSFSLSPSKGRGGGRSYLVSPVRALSQSSRRLGEDREKSYDDFDSFSPHPLLSSVAKHTTSILKNADHRSQNGCSPPSRSPPPPPSFLLKEYTPKRGFRQSSREAESTLSQIQLSPPADSLGHAKNLEDIVIYLKNHYAQESGEDKYGLETLHPEDIVTLAKCFCTDVHRLVRKRRQKMGMNVVSFAAGDLPLSGMISEATDSNNMTFNPGDNATTRDGIEEGGSKKPVDGVQHRHHRDVDSSGGSELVMDRNIESERPHEPSQHQKYQSSFQPSPQLDQGEPGTQIVRVIVPFCGTPLKRASSQASTSSLQGRPSIATPRPKASQGAPHPHRDPSPSSLALWGGVGGSANAKGLAAPFVNPQVYAARRADADADSAVGPSPFPPEKGPLRVEVPPSRPASVSVGRPKPPYAAPPPRGQAIARREGPHKPLVELMKLLRKGTHLVKYFSSFRTPHIRFFCVQDLATRFNGREVLMPHITWRPMNKDHWPVDRFREDDSKPNALNLIHLHTACLGFDLAPELFKRKGSNVIDHCGRLVPADMCVVLAFHSRVLGLSFLSEVDRQLWMEAFTAIIERNRLYHK